MDKKTKEMIINTIIIETKEDIEADIDFSNLTEYESYIEILDYINQYFGNVFASDIANTILTQTIRKQL